MGALEKPAPPGVRCCVGEDTGQCVARIAPATGRVEWPALKGQVGLERKGARVLYPGRIVGEGGELARPRLGKAQLTDRRQGLAKRDPCGKFGHQKAAPSGSRRSISFLEPSW